MDLADLRQLALSFPETTEEPHHHFGSFRVRGKIFATFPPGDEYLHLFLSEAHREQALVLHPDFTEKLLWGGKVVGLRIQLQHADPAILAELLHQAWHHKAPKALRK